MNIERRYRRHSIAPAAPPRARFAFTLLLTFAALVAVGFTYYFARAQRCTVMTNALYHTVELRKDVERATKANEQLCCKLAELQRPEYILSTLRQRGVHLAVAPIERIVYVKLPRSPAGDAAVTPAPVPAPAPVPPVRKPLGTLLVSTRTHEKQ